VFADTVLVDQTYVLDDAGVTVQKVIDAERKRLGLDAVHVEGFLRYAVGETAAAEAAAAAAAGKAA
jgi:translation elongation factor EF-Ts